MKIISTSNFNQESYIEFEVATNIKNEELGKIAVNALNAAVAEDSPDFYMLVPDEQKLWKGLEELI